MSTPDQQIANLQKLLKNIPDSDTEYISAIIKQIDNIRRREQTDQQIANLQKLLKNIPDSDTEYEYISAIIKQIDNIRRRKQIGGKKKSRRNQSRRNQSRHWNQSKRRKSNKKN